MSSLSSSVPPLPKDELARSARAVSRSSPADLLPLLSVLVLAYVLCAIQSFLVEGVLIKVIRKLNPIRFFKGIWPAAAATTLVAAIEDQLDEAVYNGEAVEAVEA